MLNSTFAQISWTFIFPSAGPWQQVIYWKNTEKKNHWKTNFLIHFFYLLSAPSVCGQNVHKKRIAQIKTCPLNRSVCFTDNYGWVQERRRVEKSLSADVKDKRRLENLFPSSCPFVPFSFLPFYALSLLVPLSPSMALSLHHDPWPGNE